MILDAETYAEDDEFLVDRIQILNEFSPNPYGLASRRMEVEKVDAPWNAACSQCRGEVDAGELAPPLVQAVSLES